MIKSSDKITNLKGVGPKTAALFGKMGIETIEDLVHLYPRYYVTYDNPIEASDVKIGEPAAVRLILTSPLTVQKTGKLTLVT